jgi:hypothetical protein
MKKLAWLLFLILIIYYVPNFCHQKTDGFTISKIQAPIPYYPQWQENKEELPDVFDQKYNYLDSGGQAYAFASEDGKYVLKFFKRHLRTVPLWLRVLPLPETLAAKREAQRVKRERKLHRDYESYILAMQYLPEETGLLYLHLNRTLHLKTVAHIVDKIGIEHTIALDKVPFILQKRAINSYAYIESLLENGELEKAKEAIDSILALIASRSMKGIYDADVSIHRNLGFYEQRAMIIDVGRFKLQPTLVEPKAYREHLYKVTRRLSTHLEEMCPQLAEYLDERVKEGC